MNKLKPAIELLRAELVQNDKKRKIKNLRTEQANNNNSNFVFRSGPKRANFSLSEDPE
jgi:hypothetical protein